MKDGNKNRCIERRIVRIGSKGQNLTNIQRDFKRGVENPTVGGWVKEE
jgi:hypothetical protein